jgi:hypothetical protein
VIGTAEPCLRIADDDTVVTDTIDASGLDVSSLVLRDQLNLPHIGATAQYIEECAAISAA